uniref:Uncharacterized protein n=1 Tax=Parascaris equorum TaxID=6256 RepID=A0A914R721_PAREQ
MHKIRTKEFSASLSDPQDVCLMPNKGLAVADQDLGVFVFSINGELRKNFNQLAGAGSLCYNSVLDQLAIVRYNGDVNSEDAKYELCTVNSNIELETLTFKLPDSPKVKAGYVRWIESIPETGNYLITTGDSSVAAVWMFNVKW